MSIRLLQAIFLSGVYTAADGATLSLAPGLEDDLVGQGKAVRVSMQKSGTQLLNHALEHSRLGLYQNPGGRDFGKDKILPVHHPVMDPDILSGLPLTIANITLSYDVTEKERSQGSLKIAVAAAVSTNTSPRLPLPVTNSSGLYPKLNSRVHVRIKCSDWTKVTRLYINFGASGGTAVYQLTIADGAGDSVYGIHSGFDSTWSGKWRTLVLSADRSFAQGGALDWCTYNVPDSSYTTDGLFFNITTTAAVNFWIDRIYSPRWPVGHVSIIGDGSYKTFRDIAVPAFNDRGWRCGSSLYLGSGVGIYPAVKDLAEIANAGHDIVAHMFHTDTHLAFGASSTKTDVKSAFYNQMSLLAGVANPCPSAMRWCQFLQNTGRLSTNDMATVLRTLGVNASRGDVSDPEYGVNPHAGIGAIVQQGTSSRTGAAPGGWCPERGRFNRRAWGLHGGLATPALRDTYANSPMQKAVEFAANHGDGITAFAHQIIPEPDTYNIGPQFWSDMMDDLDAKVANGKLLVLSPTELERLTYWRDGDVYMRWDGEWVYRSDPTTIAF